MKNDLISVIVPVYNVEKYIEKSVNSIIKQKYKNIEILLIDDGSTDNSGIICDELEKIDSRIRTFHKENGGLSDARNYGLSKCKGKFVCFVDSDDCIDCEMIEVLYNLINSEKADIAVCEFKIVYDGDGEIYSQDENTIIKVYDSKEALIELVNLKSGFAPNVCNKLFKKALFTSDCLFPKGKLYEDMIVTSRVIGKSSKVAYINKKLYYYYQRGTSITNVYNDKELDHIKMSMEMLNYIKNSYPMIYSYYEVYHCVNYLSVINKMITSEVINVRFCREAKKFIFDKYKTILKINTISALKKIQFLIFLLSFNLYKILYKLWR